ncbi:RimK family alpha-L-glutamate ligase [uncultured Jatrophihabitans sp.]|uniref:ATP-grasp domain-containing protein n=1 Tax=uncultured Jatrophihabitans sp. TaxID=1610747 RepID=UPI0035C98F4C
MSRIVLATCTRLPDGDDDAQALGAALRSCGVQPQWAAWDDPTVDWSGDLVVLRSTWDYPNRRAEFLTWTASVPHLANPAEVVAWNSDKRYLADLAATGLDVVPTAVADPANLEVPDADEFVVKPSVGAGSGGVGRFRRDARGLRAARAHLEALHAAGYTALVQPYLADVDTRGETALVYVDGTFSHAARKGPMLAADARHPLGGQLDDELFVPEAITARKPSDAELAVGDAAVAAVRDRFGSTPLYARVDLLPSAGGPVVVELELIEPSLFLDCAESAATTFAAAIAARI